MAKSYVVTIEQTLVYEIIVEADNRTAAAEIAQDMFDKGEYAQTAERSRYDTCDVRELPIGNQEG